MKSYQVYWTAEAKKDLKEIIEYIAIDSVEIAKSQLLKLRTAAQKLESFPGKGRIVPELKIHNIERYHELIISPWRLMYRFDQENVFVLAVIDGRRNIEDILLARRLR